MCANILLYLYVCEHIVISLCVRTYETERAMWGDMFYSATITLVPPVTVVSHGLLPLHPIHNIHLLSFKGPQSICRLFWRLYLGVFAVVTVILVKVVHELLHNIYMTGLG